MSRPRIVSVDVLRGFALFGMILVHFHQAFRESVPGLKAGWGEDAIGWVVWWGVEQKAASTFAFLFGIGFAIVMRSALADGRALVPFYLRRLAVLAAIGVAVEAFTGYAILIHYAIWGVPLLLVRNWSSRSLIVLAIVAAMAFPLYRLGLGLYQVITESTVAPGRPGAGEAAVAATYGAEVIQRLGQMRASYLSWRVILPSVSFSLFLFGFLAVRHRVIEQPRESRRIIFGAMIAGLVSWLLYWLVLPRMPDAWFSWNRNAMFIKWGLGIVRDDWLAFTYVGGLLLLLTYRPAWIGRLAGFGTAGRMALTNYVLQAGVVYYLSSKFGLAAALRPYYYVLGAMTLCAALALFSRLWLSRFRYGPLEWVWRGLTYLRIPPLRIRVPAVELQA
jgi:uncharacterized protein